MASTSSNTLQWNYDVFLSFRGKDTRRGIISHLEKALRQNQIGVFIDKQLSGGEEIASALWGKIEGSKISVVVFSKSYADSPWCLDELVKIAECKDRLKQMVLPVFYEIDPTDVQDLTGSFGDAIAKHQKEFGPDRVDSWSNALRVIANLRGWDSRNFESDSELIEEIVGDILKKLEFISISSYDFPGLVGIESRVKEAESLLCIGSIGVCIVGIWGMGGIGKTTIAGAVYDRISDQFDGRCFMSDVRKKLESRTKDDLINEICCEVLEKEKLNTGGPITPRPIKNMLQKRKVLVVLDDLNRSHQEFLSQLAADLSCPGSRIIVTSRDKHVIENERAKLYEVKGLNKEEACQLFILHAFKRSYDPTEEHALLGSVVRYCKGNPLALKILGCNLYNKSIEVWKDELAKIEKIPIDEIQKIIRISYDGLDSDEKSIFLYIACFFKGQHKNHVEMRLDACGYHAKSGISRLIDKSLITISSYDIMEMHDLLEQMGKDIVCEECRNNPGKRSKLWDFEDVHHVLSGDKGTETIEAISLFSYKHYHGHIDVSRTAFERMSKLRLLEFCTPDVRIPESFDFLPNSLQVLNWGSYPLKSLPSNFSANNLVELVMCDSSIEHLWDGVQPQLMNLKVLDLYGSEDLISVDFSNAPNLEIINLSYCTSLVEVSSSIRNCGKLTSLNLSGCKNITKFPDVPWNIKKLLLDGTAIEQVPSSIKHLSHLYQLSLAHNESLESLPRNIGQLKCLHGLYLGGCTKLASLPDSIRSLSQLVDLQLSGCTSLESLPSNIGKLTCLKKLALSGCSKLASLPNSIGSLSELVDLQLSGCISLESHPSNIGQLKSLKMLDLFGCTKLASLPDSTCSLSQLVKLQLKGCINFESLPSDIGHLKCIKELDLGGFTKLIRLPDSISNLSQLIKLQLRGCISLESLPSNIGQLKCLKHFTLCGCSKLTSLPSSICNLESLLELCLHGCVNLNGLPNNLGNFKSVEWFTISSSTWGCPRTHSHKKMELHSSIPLRYYGISEIPKSLGALVSLKGLCLSGTNIESIPATIKQLSRLQSIDLTDCEKLRCLPELPLSLKVLDACNCTSLRSVASLDQFAFGEGKEETRFNFSNCFNLDETKIMVDAQLIFQCGLRRLRVCIPGSEVPEWFSHKEAKSSLTAKPHGEDCKILGWAFCVVTRFYSSNGGTVGCRLEGKEEIECRFSSRHYLRLNDLSYPKSEHVILWNTLEYPWAVEKATFYCKSFGLIGKQKVIKCGLHPIFDNRTHDEEDEY